MQFGRVGIALQQKEEGLRLDFTKARGVLVEKDGKMCILHRLGGFCCPFIAVFSLY